MVPLLWLFGSIALVSLISIVGVIALGLREKHLRKALVYMVSFSAGALMGGAFIHLLPETVEEFGFGTEVGLFVLSGIVLFFVIEKVIKWHHCHGYPEGKCPHKSFTYMNLIGDGVHNFIDGLIIAGSYLVSIPLGIATTVAVIFHEIPQEIGDFGVLLHGGWSKKKALAMNFVSACAAFLGAIIALFLSTVVENITFFLLPFTAGGFIYIAGTDLIPELHKHISLKTSLIQLVSFLFGMWAMLSLLGFE